MRKNNFKSIYPEVRKELIMNNMKKGKSLFKRIAVAVLALSLMLVPAPVKGAEKASTKGDEGLVSLIAHL